MTSMLLLLNEALSSAREADTVRAGRRARPRREIPSRVALLARAAGRRGMRLPRRPAHA